MGQGPVFIINNVRCVLDVDDQGRVITESVGSQGPEADVVMKCAWTSRYQLIRGLLNSFTAAGLGIIRFSAFPYPDSPNLLALTIGQITGVKYRTLPNGWGTYEWARIPVHFGRPSWDAVQYGAGGVTGAPDPSGRPYTSTKIKAAAQVFSPPMGQAGSSALYFVGPGILVPNGLTSIVQCSMEISIARHMMPFLPLYAISQCLGHVNDDTLYFGGDLAFGAGQVLCVGADTELKPDPSSGDRCWDITYSLMCYTDHTWNQLIGPGGVYFPVNTMSTGAGLAPYATQQLNPLLFTDNFQFYYPANNSPWL